MPRSLKIKTKVEKMKKFFSAVIAAILIACCALPLAGCANKWSGWKTVSKKSGEARLEYVCELKLADSSTEVVEAWINVSVENDCQVTVDMKNYSTSKKKVTLNLAKSDVKKAKDGWILIASDFSEKCTRAVISTYDTLTVNEIVFFTTENKKDDNGKEVKDEQGNVIKVAKMLTPSFERGGVQVSTDKGKGESFYSSKEELAALSKSDPAYTEFPAYNVIDEQSKFPTELIKYVFKAA